jgi:fumarate reductase subunit D
VGLGLLYLATVLLVGAIAHRWRSPRRFFWLFLGSLIGFPVFAVAHNLLYALGELSADVPVLPWIFEGLHVVGFLIAVVLCPAGAFVGLAGVVITVIQRRRRHPAIS